jgi:hypothetical protein
VRRPLKPANTTPRDIIGDKKIAALKEAGFVVVPLSDLSQLRANIKSVLDILSNKPTRKE